MKNFQQVKVLITGGTKGLGQAVVNELVVHGAEVTVIARHVKIDEREGVSFITGDATDKDLIDKVIEDIKPTLLILNAGATPVMSSIDEQDWENFSSIWNTDLKATFHGIQAALKTPLPNGSRVQIISSGAAIGGSPLSGGYAGAKRMQWFLAQYANGVAAERNLDIHFQAIVPMQIIADTELGRKAALAYAEKRNITLENFLAARGIDSLTPKAYASYFMELLTDENYSEGIAFGINYNGITKLQ